LEKKPFKVVSVQILCEADVTRNKNKKTFKVVSVQVLCEADVTRNNNKKTIQSSQRSGIVRSRCN
jgi:hypothetical protein